jgi:hypothetical protein
MMTDQHPPPVLSPRRGQLASFAHAYRVAIQQRRCSGVHQFVVSTGDPLQPFRTTNGPPHRTERLLALVA